MRPGALLHAEGMWLALSGRRGELNMRHAFSVTLLVCVMSMASLTAQSGVPSPADARVLATVQIGTAVTAGGAPLPVGTYELRLTGERPAPLAGQPQNGQEWVEFVADGKIVAREAAEILNDGDLEAAGEASQRVKSGTRVEMLKGGEFLRISVKRERNRYLIYLPVKK
jgi:hypothetical protein